MPMYSLEIFIGILWIASNLFILSCSFNHQWSLRSITESNLVVQFVPFHLLDRIPSRVISPCRQKSLAWVLRVRLSLALRCLFFVVNRICCLKRHKTCWPIRMKPRRENSWRQSNCKSSWRTSIPRVTNVSAAPFVFVTHQSLSFPSVSWVMNVIVTKLVRTIFPQWRSMTWRNWIKTRN